MTFQREVQPYFEIRVQSVKFRKTDKIHLKGKETFSAQQMEGKE